MSAPAAPRLVLRQTRLLRRLPQRRYASTEEATDKAKSAASNVQSKASEGLSRVTSSAGPALSGAASRVGNAVSGIGGRTGRLIKFVESLVPPTVYYSRVGLELSKLVFKGQKMNPPDVSTVQRYFNLIPQSVRDPGAAFRNAGFPNASLESFLNHLRNMNRAQWAAVGVVSAELIGFFTVGEMIGRRKIVGYRGDNHHGGH